jgi:hypothetical protein
VLAVSRQADLDLQHEAGLEGVFFDEGVGNEEVIDSRAEIVGCETKIGALLRALEEACGGHDASVLQAVPDLIDHEMAACEVGSDAEAGCDGALDQCGERELLKLVHHD